MVRRLVFLLSVGVVLGSGAGTADAEGLFETLMSNLQRVDKKSKAKTEKIVTDSSLASRTVGTLGTRKVVSKTAPSTQTKPSTPSLFKTRFKVTTKSKPFYYLRLKLPKSTPPKPSRR